MRKAIMMVAVLILAAGSTSLAQQTNSEPLGSHLCKSEFASGCGTDPASKDAHQDGDGTMKFNVVSPHSWACGSCPDKHPTEDDECWDAFAQMQEATVGRTPLNELAEASPTLLAYTAGSDSAELLCDGNVVAVIPVEADVALASLVPAMTGAAGLAP